MERQTPHEDRTNLPDRRKFLGQLVALAGMAAGIAGCEETPDNNDLIKLPCNEKLLPESILHNPRRTVTTYLTRPMREGEKPEIHTLRTINKDNITRIVESTCEDEEQ